MSDESQDQDRQYDPTQKKLDDARKKGEIAKSADLATAAGYGGFVIAAWSVGAVSLLSLAEGLRSMIDQPARISDVLFAGRSSPFIGGLLSALGPALAPWAILPWVIALLSILAQRGLVFAPTKLAPKTSRISLVKGIGNKFGRNGLFEFSKSFVKLLIYSVILGVFLAIEAQTILGTLYLSPAMATAELLRLSLVLMSVVLVVGLAIGGIDYVWQRAEHHRKNRMSHKEMRDEQKQSEGDPQMKQQRRQKAVTLAMNQMLADVPQADVVIVNPTHYAVALKWDRRAGQAPTCVAKGVDLVAERIRDLATEAGVPLHSDPPTARALHATIDIGQEISTEHYRAVAAAIRFAEKIRARAGPR